MSKWKCEICNKEFNNFHAQGFDGKVYCPLCYFKEDKKRLIKWLKDEITRLHYDTNGSYSSVIYGKIEAYKEVLERCEEHDN